MRKLTVLLIATVLFSCGNPDELQSMNPSTASLGIPSKTFFSTQSGNWNDTLTWLEDSLGTWVSAKSTPTSDDDVYIDRGDKVTLTGDESCLSLRLNGFQDVRRIVTKPYDINVYGALETFTGNINSYSLNGKGAGSGVAGWLDSLQLRFVGSDNRDIFGTFTANSRSAGWSCEIAVGATTEVGISKTVRVGYLTVSSGIVDTGIEEIRIAGNDYIKKPGNGINGGTLLIKDGAIYKTVDIHKNNPDFQSGNEGGLGLASIEVESGGILQCNNANPSPNIELPALNVIINGTIKLVAGTQKLPSQRNIPSMDDVDTLATVVLGGSGNKTLNYNTTITDILEIEGTANLSLGGYTLTYDSADLVYSSSRVSGDELPTIGSGLSQPTNLVIGDGVTLDLNGETVDIHGSISLGLGSSIINGTVNENQ